MHSIRQLLSHMPHRLHWTLVVLMAVVIPAATRRTEKPGEFYPFSNFPMYSRFAPETYYVFVTDLKDEPIAVGRTFGTAISNAKKSYDQKLTNLKKKAGGKGRKADLPDEARRVAADEVLRWLAESAPDRALVRTHGGLRLHHVDVIFKDGQVSKHSRQVGEIHFDGP